MKKQYLCEVMFAKDAPYGWTNISLMMNYHRYPSTLDEARSVLAEALREYNSTDYFDGTYILASRIRVRSVTPWRLVDSEVSFSESTRM